MKTKYWIGLLVFPFLIQCNTKSNVDAYQFVPLDSLIFNAVLIDLGNKLFFDTRLSLNDSISCATCHNPKMAFTDGKKDEYWYPSALRKTELSITMECQKSR